VKEDATLVIDGLPLYRCAACGKQHLQWVGRACPCGEPFPNEVKQDSRMDAACWRRLRERGGGWWL
jgi:predicted ATP-dependent serine protease